jgi:hypothetical protein
MIFLFFKPYFMSIFSKFSKFLTALAVILILAGPTNVFAATAPALGSLSSFSVLAHLSMSAAGAGTVVSNDLGLSSGLAGSKTGPWTVGGTEYFGPASLAATANASALSAFNNLALQGSDGVWSSASPVPGVWTIGADQTFAGTLTLNGGYDDVWVFQIGNDLTFAGSVVLTGNAQPCHVFWQVGRDATIAVSSTFVGTLIASRDVTIVSGATVNGRVVSLTSSLTTDGNNITAPTCSVPTANLHIIKHVINDDSGSAVAGAFTINVTGTNLSTSSFAGSEAGVDITLDAGSYTVDESAFAGYTKSLGANCSGTIASGETKTCTITNDDSVVVATSTINVVKTVINDNGRNRVIADFPLFVNGVPVVSGDTNVFPASTTYTITETSDSNYVQSFSVDCNSSGVLFLAPGENKVCIITNDDKVINSGGGGSSYVAPVPPIIDVVKVPSPLALPAGPGLVNYAYTLRNIGTVPVNNITMVGDTCRPIVLASGDTNHDSILDLTETWVYQCSTTLLATHTNTVVATGWANGVSATDIANATVVVGIPVVPPLIHVTKIPNPLTLPAKGGMVTYTETITNPGAVALNHINLTDNKCDPMQYVSGDINGDAKLDTTEAWVYTCKTNLTKTTMNTAIAEGSANGLTVRDIAVATVVVAVPVPKLPNTGLPAEEGISGIAIIAGVVMLLISTSLVLVLKKRVI